MAILKRVVERSHWGDIWAKVWRNEGGSLADVCWKSIPGRRRCRCKGPEVAPCLILLVNFESPLPTILSLKTDKHKCRLPKLCRKCAASPPVTQPPVFLTLNAFVGLKCRQEAGELPWLQKNGMGWGGLRWCLPHLLLPKVVMGLFLNTGRKYLLFQPRRVGSLWDSPGKPVLRPVYHGEYWGPCEVRWC